MKELTYMLTAISSRLSVSINEPKRLQLYNPSQQRCKIKETYKAVITIGTRFVEMQIDERGVGE